MRITGGHYRGQILLGPDSDAIRPTSDKARLAIFNSLHSGRFDAALDGAFVLDGTAGTGAMGIEALSRGAKFVHFADNSPKARELVQKNLHKLKIGGDRYRLHPFAAQGLEDAGIVMNLVFLDPPYHQDLLPQMVDHLIKTGWADAQTMFVLEAAKEENIALPLEVLDRKMYGAAQVIYARTPV